MQFKEEKLQLYCLQLVLNCLNVERKAFKMGDPDIQEHVVSIK